jgi:hypothetical protein
MDPLEEILKRQAFRPVPPDLRAEILAAAHTAKLAPRPSPVSWLSAWLWPSPYAWAALAAAWLLIIGLNLAAQSDRIASPNHSGPTASSSDILAVLVEQRRLLDELSRPALAHTTPPPDPNQHPDSPGACLDPREPDEIHLA